MKRFLAIAALVLAAGSSAAFAQTPNQAPATAPVQTHVPNPHKVAERMGRELGLTPEQTAKLEPILADRQQKVQALRADGTLNDAQRQQQMKTIRKTAKTQLSAVLTPDQRKQLKAMHHAGKAGAAPAGV